MELDAEGLPDGARLEADLCIVGSGPAGVTLARNTIRHGRAVVLLESGGSGLESWAQDLNHGTVTDPGYAGLQPTRLRQVGGSTGLWNTPVSGQAGAKYVPLDPWDLDEWPIAWSELVPFYERAQRAAGLGPFRYAGSDWESTARAAWPFPGSRLETGVYQFGTRASLLGAALAELRAADNVRFCRRATVCALSLAGPGDRVVEATVRGPSGRRVVVQARRYVLAGGAVENARLLLGAGLGTRLDWLGRGFMEHPRDHSLRLPGSRSDRFAGLAFYDQHLTEAGVFVGGRLGPTATGLRDHALTGFSATLLPVPKPTVPPATWGGRVIRRLGAWLGPRRAGGYGWSRHAEPQRWYEGFRILLNLEQRPHPDNRLILAPASDAFGVPRVHLDWAWRPEEQARLERLRSLLVGWFGDAGLPGVVVEADRIPDPNAHHHAGTTRMSSDPRDGVVDPDGRVHGVENLYVAGASVFPSAGFANPTLTILALALRLSDHLAGQAPG